MRIFVGLFTNLDSIITDYDTKKFEGIEPVKPSKEILSKPGEIVYVLENERKDCECLIDKELFEFLKGNFKGIRKIGGNAGNAALVLNELGIPCVLSCPLRPKSIMEMLSKHKGIELANKRGFVEPLETIMDDPEFEHLSFERKDHRKIFTFDPASYECRLDEHFWKNINFADMLWLCGFHLVSPTYRNKVDLISDILTGKKCKVHLELGEGTETIRYAIKKLTDEGVLNSLGMNECETKFIGFEGDPLENPGFFSEFMKSSGLDRLTIHSIKYRLTFFRKDREKNSKAGEYSVKVPAAKLFGGIKENLERVSKLDRYEVKKIEGKDSVLIPAYVTPEPKVITGIGDASSIADALIALK